jgi:phosphoenolpyruvate synthase/pyruvate phosphate dikinase
LSKEQYIEHYGHLRPGTYDASVEAYWEAPERYLFSKHKSLRNAAKEEIPFHFSKSSRNAIENEIGKIDKGISFNSFIEYIVGAIQAREYVKFQFTRNLSRALDSIIKYGLDLGIGREEVTFLNVSDLDQLKTGALSEKNLLDLIEQRKRKFAMTQMIELPQLLFQESDFYCFERHASQANFITIQRVEANLIQFAGDELLDFSNKIVLISQADPGYDWLFGHNITGLVTKYGGANSHMAIRAAEMGLPAAIGVGEKIYEQLTNTERILLDCANHLIRRI